MTTVLSWNIQNGRGVDGKVSLERIASVVAAMGLPDVICLQEVSRGLEMPDAGTPDQVEELASLFPDYEILFGVAIEASSIGDSRRWQYGNALLSRLPLLSVRHHLLPQPAATDIKHMARQATEVVLACQEGPLRVINTHLEFHSLKQRRAQIERLRQLQEESFDLLEWPARSDEAGPYRHVERPLAGVFCGDFNMAVGSQEYEIMLSSGSFPESALIDAWTVAHPDRAHDPTCGLFDHKQWAEGPHCRDYFFVSGDTAASVRDVRVNLDTDASDHQPLKLEVG